MDLAISIDQEQSKLIQACIRKEEWAMRIVYEEYYSPMMNVIVRYAHSMDQASDWVHDGFVKVFQNLRAFQRGTSLHSWIKRIMINVAIDNIRKEKVRRTKDIDSLPDVMNRNPDVISEISQTELLAEVQKLPPSYRVVFNLYIIDGYSHKEISETVGITEGTSRSNLVRARRILQESISNKNILSDE